MHRYHLAQVNMAHGRAPIDDPLMAGFVAKLDEINALAERSPGFIWRLQSDSGNATDIRVTDDPRLLINLTVWDSLKSLFDYVYRSEHTKVMSRRREWFEASPAPTVALWWVPAGTTPTVEEALSRLDHLKRRGPTAHAFGFKESFAAPDGSGVGLTGEEARQARCA